MRMNLRGVEVPPWLYGTAWKEEATEGLVTAALEAGFRGIDTANQRKHYDESGVGRALARALADGTLRRDQLFVQTKFTFADGQDHRLPYDPRAPIADQVVQSFDSSCAHLGLEVIDSLLLHGPSQREGLGAADLEAWRAMETLAQEGRVRLLGVSNVTAAQVVEIVELARVPPVFVQNRCYAERGWDHEVRVRCQRHGLVYQGFSLLTANRHVLAHPRVVALATRHDVAPAQIVFRFARQVGILPLNGTSDPSHMRADLAIDRFELDAEELAVLERAGLR